MKKFYLWWFWKRRKARVRFSDEKQTYGFRITKGMRVFFLMFRTRLVKILIRKGIEIDLVGLTQLDPSFVGLGSRSGLIGRFRQRWFFSVFHKKVLKYDMHHATKCKCGEQCWKKCNMIWMKKWHDMIWYGGGLNQKQKMA
jgi:hypothetical protein